MVTIERILSLPVFDGAVWAAGEAGKDRLVRYVDIAEVPDIRFWVSPDVLFLTTAYALHGENTAFMDFLRSLIRNGAAGLGVKLGRFLDKLPDEVCAHANENGFPIVLLPSGLRYTHAIRAVMEAILTDERAESSSRNLFDDYFGEALFGEFPMRSLLKFEALGFSLDMQVRVVLIASEDAKIDLVLTALRPVLGDGGLLAKVRTSSETILLMAGSAEVSTTLCNSLSFLDKKVRIALGGCRRLRDFRRSYEEARQVSGLFEPLGIVGGAYALEDMELFTPLLWGEGADRVLRSARSLLEPILEYDSQNHTELLGTLHAFVQCDRNQKEAARALHLHRNTLRYRLAKIESLLPPGSFGGFSFLRLSLALLVHFSRRS